MTRKPVFFDPTGRRAARMSRLGVLAAVVSTLLVALFVSSLLVAPHMNQLTLGMHDGHAPRGLKGVKLAAPNLLKPAEKLAAEARAHVVGIPRARHVRRIHAVSMRALPIAMSKTPGTPVTLGFYVNWDDNSYPALKRALPHLDWLVPAWLSLSGPHMALTTDIDPRVLDLVHREKPTMPILPLLQNSVEGNWDGPGLARLLADPAARKALIAQVVAFLDQNRFQGLTIDFENVPATAQDDLTTFLDELSAAFQPHGWGIVLSVPFDDDNWHYTADASQVDFMLLMAYDQHWESGAPGSVAGETWFENTLDKRMKNLDPDRTIVALGNYGYDWTEGSKASANDLTFQEAMQEANDSSADISFDQDSENPHFAYDDDGGNRHDVWFLDGVTAYNEVHAADDYQPYGYAVWRLGSEDPSIWSVLGRAYGSAAPQALDHIAMGEDIDIEGRGEVLHIDAKPASGARSFSIDKDDGGIADETYQSLPTAYVIRRYGETGRKVALTFDDGPDPEWTPQILDILRDKHVPATFFVIGENAESSPRLIQREVAQGDEIGNHTFTHPNLGESPPSVVSLELNATQRLVEALTGRSMRLFRAPYFGDAEPTTADEIVPIQQAQAMGYIAVGLHVDPDDWKRPPAELIVQRVLDGVNNPNPSKRGQIVLLHDGGGDRSQTIKALPVLIDKLRAEGYSFVPVSTLAGLTRDQAMPPLPTGSLSRLADRSVFYTLGWSGHFLHSLFLLAIWLGIGRLVFLGGMALVNARRERRRSPPELPPQPSLVSVVIPAHNEDKVIALSLSQILRSSYPSLEVIVVDDGSTDATAQRVAEVAAADARVQLIRTPNGGKAHAINTGLKHARGEVVVALDADTHFEPETISRLVRWFVDPEVGAVAGNAKVGNRINLITYWQALEYITAQNLERRALAALDAITVVPGAVGAWRRAALEQLGGFPSDTLAEDQDLTLAVQQAGYRVLFDSQAVAWTEAPDTARGLARQRFRWAYGTLQCLWKHREVTLRPRYGALGMLAMPQVWLFQILFTVVSPLVDLLLLWQLGASWLDYLQHRGHFDPHNLYKMLVFYAVFVAVDLAASVLAFALEKREDWSLLWWLVLQRFGYRQLMYYVVVRSVRTAIRGPSVGWGKLERKATVNAGGD